MGGQALWDEADRMNERAFVSPTTPLAWGREDEAPRPDPGPADPGSEARLFDFLRQRGLAGDDRALTLLLRPVRGAGRGADASTPGRGEEPLPPEVAAAMIAAGLAAMGEPLTEIPPPADKGGPGRPTEA